MSQDYQGARSSSRSQVNSYLGQEDGIEMEPSQMTPNANEELGEGGVSPMTEQARWNFENQNIQNRPTQVRHGGPSQNVGKSQNEYQQFGEQWNNNNNNTKGNDAATQQQHALYPPSFSNLGSGLNSGRAISMPMSQPTLSAPLSEERQHAEIGHQRATQGFLLDQRSAGHHQEEHSAQMPLGAQNRQHSQSSSGGAQPPPGFSGPSPLIRQLSEKVRTQAERLQLMEAYQALCEKRILDFDPAHPLPVAPYHLGQGATHESAGFHGDQTSRELKNQLVLREQDLYYTKKENDRLTRQLAEQENQGRVTQQNSNFDALRKEIELNEKLQKELEMCKNQMTQMQQHEMSSKRQNTGTEEKRPSAPQSAQLSARSHTSSKESIESLKKQVVALQEEKDALLDFIEENGLGEEGVEREEKGDADIEQALRGQISDLKRQNEALMKQNYASPNFANTGTTGQDYSHNQHLPEGIHESAQENTFGNADMLQKQFQETQTQFLKEREGLGQLVQDLRQEVDRLKDDNQRLIADKASLQKLLQQTQQSQPGSASQRSHLSSHSAERLSDGGRSQHQDSNYKQRAKDLENRLKANQENTKTLGYTLNETQAELESLLREYEVLKADFGQQVREIDQLNQINKSNLKLIDELKAEKTKQEVELRAKMRDLVKAESDLRICQTDAEHEKQRTAQFEKHIRDIKDQEHLRVENTTIQWENTVGDLTKELQAAQDEVNERQAVFHRLETELKQKLVEAESTISDNRRLKQSNAALQAEVKSMGEQKQEKHLKLQNQIKKNEELLGELQALSEAVNQIKNNREFTETSQMLEEKNAQIDEYQVFVNTKQKRYLDKIFQTLLKTVEEIREFAKIYKIKASTSREDQNLQSFLMFDHVDTQLKSFLTLQKQQNEMLQNARDEASHSQGLKIATNMLKDLDLLIKSTTDLAGCLIDNYKQKDREVNKLNSELAAGTSQNKTMQEQLRQLQLEETQNREEENTATQELQTMQLTILQREREMKDTYKREERNNKNIHRLKQQLDALLKEQQKLLLQIQSLMSDKEKLTRDQDGQGAYIEKSRQRERMLEYKINSMEAQVKDVGQMVENLKQAMPSEDLQKLVSEMQTLTGNHFKLNEDYALKEQSLLEMENQLRVFAKSDTGLSQKVIQLRKDIQKNREELKKMQIQKMQYQEQNEQIISDLNNCEHLERRRHDVAIETEKTLYAAKEKIIELEKELGFVNNNRKDLETAVRGLQEQNGMLQRELSTLRVQLQGGGSLAGSRQSLGGSLAKLRSSSSARGLQQPPLYSGPNRMIETSRGQNQLPPMAMHAHSIQTMSAQDPRYIDNQSQQMFIEQNYDPRSNFNQSNLSHAASWNQGASRDSRGPGPRSLSLGAGNLIQQTTHSHLRTLNDAPVIVDNQRYPDDFPNESNQGHSEQKPPPYYYAAQSNDERWQVPEPRQVQGFSTNVTEPILSSFDKNHRVCLSEHKSAGATPGEDYQQVYEAHKRPQELDSWQKAEAQSRQQFSQMATQNSAQHRDLERSSAGGNYGTFGRRNQKSNERPEQNPNQMQPSPSMPNINRPGTESNLTYTEAYNYPKSMQPMFMNKDIAHGSHYEPPSQVGRQDQQPRPLRNMDMPLQQSERSQGNDSFNSDKADPYGDREGDTDNSLLKSSLLERHGGEPRAHTQLQTKLSQVKNVFTAIRQNLNDGSTEKSPSER